MRTWKHLGLMAAAAVVFAATPVLAGAAEYKEMMQNYIGDWVVNGTTPEGMPSVPAGVKYSTYQATGRDAANCKSAAKPMAVFHPWLTKRTL